MGADSQIVALPALYEALEQRGVAYAIRLPANQVLERAIDALVALAEAEPAEDRLDNVVNRHASALGSGRRIALRRSGLRQAGAAGR